MELNEYAIWHMKVGVIERQYAQKDHDVEYVGEQLVTKVLSICAPKGSLGRALLGVHFDNAFRAHTIIPGTEVRWQYLEEPKERQLDGVIRYEDAYRGRM